MTAGPGRRPAASAAPGARARIRATVVGKHRSMASPTYFNLFYVPPSGGAAAAAMTSFDKFCGQGWPFRPPRQCKVFLGSLCLRSSPAIPTFPYRRPPLQPPPNPVFYLVAQALFFVMIGAFWARHILLPNLLTGHEKPSVLQPCGPLFLKEGRIPARRAKFSS